MLILDDVSFILHPATGSRSLKQALMKVGADEILTHHEVCPRKAIETRACVCTIRNPYTLVASWYQRHRREDETFEDWLKVKLIGPRHYEGPPKLGLLYGTFWATHIIKFENLQQDLDAVCKELKLPKLPLEHIGKNHRPVQYRRLYFAEPATKNMVLNAYAHHIHEFQYRL